METSGKSFIPMVPSTPPPIDDGFEDEDEDDFGTFASAGFGKDLVGSPPGKSMKSKDNDRHFDFKPIENSLSSEGPAKSNGTGGEEEDDFGNFSSFGTATQNDTELGKSATQSTTKIATNDGSLFSEFSSSEPEKVESKTNGDWNHHNHIESSSNNNSAGDNIGHSNHIEDSEESLKCNEDQEQDYSFRLKLSKENTLDLRQPSTYDVVEDDTSGDLNWDNQGAATPRSRSPENSTSGSHTPVTSGEQEPSESTCVLEQDEGLTLKSASETEHLENKDTDNEFGDFGQEENKDDDFGDFASDASSNVVLDPNLVVSSDLGNVPSKESKNLDQTDESLETQEIASRTRHDSFGDFSTGPTVVQGTDSSQKETTEISHVDNNVKVTQSVDISKTFHEDDDDGSSLGRPEPPAFPDDHDDEEDEFGDFGTVSKSSDDFGDFGDFKSTFSNKSEQLSSIANKTKNEDDFGGFESSSSMPQTGNVSSTKTDDFGDFGAFRDSKAADSGEDDFGDFGAFEGEKKPEDSSGFASFQSSSGADWATSPTKPTQSSTAWSGTSNRVDRVFQTCFPATSPSAMPSIPEPVEVLFTLVNSDFGTKGQVAQENQNKSRKKGSGKTVCVSVWANLSDLENTQAVKYQWASSGNCKLLLASLGIDSRNILASNKAAGIPIFAANLGMLTPSKPGEKSEHLDEDTSQDTPEDNTSTIAPTNNVTSPDESVPKAEFDWSSSGLTNPLDANSLNLDFFTKEGKKCSSSGGTGSKSKSRSGFFSRLLNKSDCDTDSDDSELPNSSKLDKTKGTQPKNDLHASEINQTAKVSHIIDPDSSSDKSVEASDISKLAVMDRTMFTEANQQSEIPNKDPQTPDILKPSIIDMASSTEVTQKIESSKLHPCSSKDLQTPANNEPSEMSTTCTSLTEAIEHVQAPKLDYGLNKGPQISNILNHTIIDTTMQVFKSTIVDKLNNHQTSDVSTPLMVGMTSEQSQASLSETCCEDVTESEKEVTQSSHTSDFEPSIIYSTAKESQVSENTSLLDNKSSDTSENLKQSIEALTLQQLEDFDPFSLSSNEDKQKTVPLNYFETTELEKPKPSEEAVTPQHLKVFSPRQSNGEKPLTFDNIRTSILDETSLQAQKPAAELNKDNIQTCGAFSPMIMSNKERSQTSSDNLRTFTLDKTFPNAQASKPAAELDKDNTQLFNAFSSITLPDKEKSNTFDSLRPFILDKTIPDLQASKPAAELDKDHFQTCDAFSHITVSNKEKSQTCDNLRTSILDGTFPQVQASIPAAEVDKDNPQTFDAFGIFTSSNKVNSKTYDNFRTSTSDETFPFIHASTPADITETFDAFKSSLVDMTALKFVESKTESKSEDSLLSDVSTPLTLDNSEAPPIDPEILGLEINIPTPAKPPQNISKPLDDILKNSSTSTMVTQRNKRDDNLMGESKKILDGIPNLSFMHAKVLMFPVGQSPLTRHNGDDFSGKRESTL